jgi:EmrB/QacA subfamily drug resistance transporter
MRNEARPPDQPTARAAAPPDGSAAPPAARSIAAPGRPWGETLTKKRIVLVLLSVNLSMLLGALDQTVVGTAMPRVIADLNGLKHYAWVATAYMLASTISMPIWGKLSDAYGRKRFYLVGMTFFIVGSALCGTSRSMGQLVAFRAIQGLGNGAMVPIDQAIIGDIFPPAQRAKWSSILMSIFGLATLFGPVLGGAITDSIGWRWTFYVNLPVGIIAMTFIAFALPGHSRRTEERIDWAGATVLVLAAVPLLLGLSWAGSTYAWSSPVVIGLLVGSAAMWVVFFRYELMAADPVLNPRLFGNRTFSVSTVASMAQSATMFGVTMFLPLFVQGVMGKTATSSGTILMPMMIASMISGIGTGQVLSRTGRYKGLLVGGFVLLTVSAFLLSRLSAGTSSGAVAGYIVILGAGLGIIISSFTPAVQNQYPTYRLGEVTAGLSFFRSIGGTTGLAVFGTLLNSRFASVMSTALPGDLTELAADPAVAEQLYNPQVLLSGEAGSGLTDLFRQFGDQSQRLFEAFVAGVRGSLESALGDIFLVITILAAAGLVLVLFLKEVPLRRTHLEAEAPASGDDGGAGTQ